jgi:hypothetical protein
METSLTAVSATLMAKLDRLTWRMSNAHTVDPKKEREGRITMGMQSPSLPAKPSGKCSIRSADHMLSFRHTLAPRRRPFLRRSSVNFLQDRS